MRNILKVIFVIIAALIGAGFASGQEIYVFFYRHGFQGIYGIIVCSIVMGLIIYKVFKLLQKYNVGTYKEFVQLLTKKSSQKSKYLNGSFITNTIVNVFLLITFYIMIAGFGAYFSQEFNINNYIGSTLLALVCYFTLKSNVSGVVEINSILVPMLIIFIIVIGIINIMSINVATELENLKAVDSSGWLLNSILYSSYNSILLIPVLITLNKYIKSKKDIIVVSAVTSIIIIILAIMIFLLLTRVDIELNMLEMPIVYVISKFFESFKIIYAFIILASIYTTAISIGVSFLTNVTKNDKIYMYILSFMCITSVLISGFGFSNLVSILYPIFGYLGLVQIGALIVKK